MKLALFLALFGIALSAVAEPCDPYIPRSNSRPAYEALLQLESSPHFYEFQKELKRTTGLTFGDLRVAAEQGDMKVRPCGDCVLFTSCIRNGKSDWHRRVKENEPVAFVGDIPVFLPACGNNLVDPFKNPTRNRVVRVITQPAPPAVPPELPKETKAVSREGCSQEQIAYTSSHWDLPSSVPLPWPYGPLAFTTHSLDVGGLSWVTSHHFWLCRALLNTEENTHEE